VREEDEDDDEEPRPAKRRRAGKGAAPNKKAAQKRTAIKLANAGSRATPQGRFSSRV
jgi:hypothetical protein